MTKQYPLYISVSSSETFVPIEPLNLHPATAGQWQADLKVRGAPSGQYAATVLVNEVPVSTQRIVISH